MIFSGHLLSILLAVYKKKRRQQWKRTEKRKRTKAANQHRDRLNGLIVMSELSEEVLKRMFRMTRAGFKSLHEIVLKVFFTCFEDSPRTFSPFSSYFTKRLKGWKGFNFERSLKICAILYQAFVALLFSTDSTDC